MDYFCYSCSAPLSMPEYRGPAEHYCKHCTDENGNLKSKEMIQKGIAQWLQGWKPDLDEKKALERAQHFMKSMPAWAE